MNGINIFRLLLIYIINLWLFITNITILLFCDYPNL